MSITIKNEETDRLVRELANIRGISLVDAVHEAVQEKLQQARRKALQVFDPWLSDYDELLETDPEAAAVLAIDERRLLVARYFGMDKALRILAADFWLPALLMTLALFLAPFFERPRHSLSVGIILLDAVMLIFYLRLLSKQENAREQARQSLKDEISLLCMPLPPSLQFMSRMPGLEADYGLLEKSDIGHLTPTRR